jgi:oligoribonuclease
VTDTPFLFCDVETTCLDEQADHAAILEIGFALVSPDLDVIERASWVMPHFRTMIDHFRAEADQVVRDMHDASGLWDACVAAFEDDAHPPHPLGEACAWVATHASDPTIPLTGSSVHFDARWLDRFGTAAVMAGRTHRLPDPSGLREMLDRWKPRGPQIVAGRPPARKLHRVDADIDDTIAEMRYYRDALGLGAPPPVWTATPNVMASQPSWTFNTATARPYPIERATP